MLGTGTPVPNADRAGSSVAIIYNNQAYVFDAGPGMVRNALVAAQTKGIEALYPTHIQHLFLTHLHSDHVMDVSELASTYWWRRDKRLNIYGPTGTQTLVNGYYKMLSEDIHLRINSTQPVKDPSMYQVNVSEYKKGGWSFKDGPVSVEAFLVQHGDIEPAFGYKIMTPDKCIVISGDTRYDEKIATIAKGADILIHEVISEEGLSRLSPEWQKYHSNSHTRSGDLAKLAAKAKPDLLILTHVLHYSAPITSVLKEVQAGYKGKVVLANDLDIFGSKAEAPKNYQPGMLKPPEKG
ncbi:MBL fold metallo-hydrolase [Endozoicomonas arenosclerae]|uniref:MBL fold metallo-hydrolase n=1 Tax=Endozoicomonas arenosclerae TaxID=1633495 RepID=UPI001FE08866|nr:MBL fold metallo-hydrolase [Endozoicomonas arenosclerae]